MAFVSLRHSALAWHGGRRLPSARTIGLISLWVLLAIPLVALACVAWAAATFAGAIWNGFSGYLAARQRID